MTSDQGAKGKTDFMAAEEITGILRGREQAEQERIVRWVCESLGFSLGNAQLPLQRQAAPAPVVQHSPMAIAPDVAPRAVDIRTFVQEKQPKSDVQFVAVVAHYHRFIAPEGERKETMTTGDLQTAARLAQRPVFKTPSVPLNNSVQMGYMDRAGRGAYRLNAVGENLVAMTLPGGGDVAASPTKRRGNSRRKAPPKKASPGQGTAKGKRAK
jgi:hypothetical protein